MNTWANLESTWRAVGSTWLGIFKPPRIPAPQRQTPGITVTLDGTGTIGNIIPGWTVSEFATPVIIGDQRAGTGDVAFSAKGDDDSLIIINDSVRFQHNDDAGDLGYVEGVVRRVGQSGLTASVNHSTPLERFNTDRFIPALGVGSGWAAVDLALQLTGFVYLNPNPYES